MAAREPTAILQADPGIRESFHVAVNDPSIPDDVAALIGDQVREWLNEHLRERPAVERTAEEIVKESHFGTTSPAAGSLVEFAAASPGTGATAIADTEARALEEKIQTIVKELNIPRGRPSVRPFVTIAPAPPGQRWLLRQMLSTISVPPPWVIAVYTVDRADGIRMEISGPNVWPSGVYVTLSREVAWDKEVFAWKAAYESGLRYSFSRAPMARHIVVSTALADALVFRKPKFLGIWHDLNHFDMNEFVASLNTRRVDFNWRFD